MTTKLDSKDYSWILLGLFIAIVITGILSTTSLGPLIQGKAVQVVSGHIYGVNLEARQLTNKWVGMTITNDANSLNDSADPFYTINVSTFSNSIETYQFPGANLKDDLHYYAAMIPDKFNATRLANMTLSDLDENGTFSSSEFSVFYPGYEQYNTNPNMTFCCDTDIIMINSKNYTAFNITLNQSVNYYLVNYNNSGNMTPLFLTPLEDTTCYNGSSCVSQFILPVADADYNFYAINKLTPYVYDIWIDGVSTTTFSQTAQPYNLTVEASELYTGIPASNMSIVIGEENGQNIFIPYILSGYISNAYSVGFTDDNGRETFLVVPTATANVQNYSIYVAMLVDGMIASKYGLSITTYDEIIFQSKPLSPTRLYDNAKAAANAMNQINSYLFRWASEYTRAREFYVTYDLNTSNFTVAPQGTTTGNFIQTGGVNAITVFVKDTGFPVSGYSMLMREKEGYLIVNPYTDNVTLTDTEKNHMLEFPNDTEIIITPTSYGDISSNITLEILDSQGDTVDTYEFNISSELALPGDVSSSFPFDNDLLKTIVNAMNQVLYSLYYSLNF